MTKTSMTKDKLWEKSNAAFGDFMPGIRSDMVCRKHTDCTNGRPHIVRHVWRYAAVALLASTVGLTASYWCNWRSDNEVSDSPIMVPGGGANIVNGYAVRLPMDDTLVMPPGI